MHPDLELLIRLQSLDDATARAKQTIADMPSEVTALDARLVDKEQQLAAARQRLDDCQRARRELEKQLAAVQTRLSRYKEQLMEVKTNKEYQAMQHEIATAEREVRTTEDRILDRMEEGEEITKDVKRVEAEVASERAAVTAAKKQLDELRVTLDAQIERAAGDRADLVAGISAEVMAIFDAVARKRSGVAVVEARDGHCSVCNVRLRPQRFLEVRRNDDLIQCESCQRILYYVVPPGGEPPVPADA
jgi:predicted  nucleic acid-binding Zn-ribbon protein